MPVLVYIENETGVNRNVVITAEHLDDGRGMYNEAVIVPPDHTTNLGHLTNTDQVVRVVLIEGAADAEQSDVEDGQSGAPDDAQEDDDTGTTDDGDGEDSVDGDDGPTDAPGDGYGGAEREHAGDEYDDSDDDVEAIEETLIGEATQSITVHITDDGLHLEIQARDRN